MRRALYGALAGAGGTLALSGLRRLMELAELVHATAPEQVVSRLEELGLLQEPSRRSRAVIVLAAHFAYGVSVGGALGILRRERGGLAEEAAVGSALGILSWGAGWAAWLPLFGVHSPPWRQGPLRALLPVADHAFFGAVWGGIQRLSLR